MTEKILTNKKHGMAMLIFFLLLMAAAIVMVVIGAMRNIIALILPGIVILCFIWIPMMGLKILKPQEALVLTLFGHYYGTLKGEGYYYVNPFCTGVNPAAKTRLSQSGDVKTLGVKATTGDNTTSIEVDTTGKKLSLKIMTLSNNRQKINDCLGIPWKSALLSLGALSIPPRLFLMWITTKNTFPCSAIAPCAISCVCTPTMLLPM